MRLIELFKINIIAAYPTKFDQMFVLHIQSSDLLIHFSQVLLFLFHADSVCFVFIYTQQITTSQSMCTQYRNYRFNTLKSQQEEFIS